MDADGILLGDGVDIRVVAADGERAVVVAPKVRAVDTNGEAFEELCTDAEIHLPHAARAGMCLGGCGGRCAHGGGGRVVVADIAERYYTETAAHVFHQSECGDGIFEISVVGVELTVAFLEVCHLSAEAHVEDHRQGIDGRVGGGVEHVDLVRLAQTQSQPVHAAVESLCLF